MDAFPSEEDNARVVGCLSDYFDTARVFHHNISEHDHGQRQNYYFRGQAKGEADGWNIISSLARPDYQATLCRTYGTHNLESVQTYLVHRLKRLAEQHSASVTQLPPPREFLSWLTIAQHYGLPTFLTDWSLNPLVGLYFACEDAIYDRGYFSGSRPSTTYGADGFVYAIDLLTQVERRKHKKAYLIHLDESSREGPGQGGMNYEDMQFRKYEEATLAAIEDNGLAEYPTIIVPRLITKRIDAQAGRFIYWQGSESLKSYSEGGEINTRGWRSLKPICRIPKDKKVAILEELITYRIHPGTMRADMEGYSQYLKWGGL